MRKNFPDKYYVGLDCGTNSVGWAVTDENYNIFNFNGKAMWGSRLFDEADVAAERRLHRSERRRRQRDIQRIELIQDLFASEISKVDPGFYMRLKDSFFFKDDKHENQSNSLFNDDDYHDADYHQAYPTVYHLRSALMHDDRKFDIRLIYLAVHHIMKKRGHFLFENSFDTIPDLSDALNAIDQSVSDNLGMEFMTADIGGVMDVLRNRNYGAKVRCEKLSALFNIDKKNKPLYEIVKMISGMKSNFSTIFDDETMKEEEGLNSIKLSEFNLEEKEGELISFLGDDYFGLFTCIKAIYDWGILASLMGDEKTLSDAKCRSYEKHKRELRMLKDLIREFMPEKYNMVFRDCTSKKHENYCYFIGTAVRNGKKVSLKKCGSDIFYKFLKKEIFSDLMKEHADDIRVQELNEELENGELLKKQASVDNSLVPKQINESELKRILEKASVHYDFLNVRDSDGLSVRDKIMKIFNYRIPYYVGPLNTHSDKSWVVRNSSDKITPWNFDKVVNLDASAEQFITRMTNKCTYLTGKDVLPKNSLLYGRFMVLNELNNLRIRDEKIDVETKQKIFSELFMKKRRVTEKALRNFLVAECGYSKDDVSFISGIDGDFKSNLSSYLDFKELIDAGKLSEADVEVIIRTIVLFGDSRELIERRLTKTFGQSLTSKDVKYICSKHYTGWGRLSGEFLNLLGLKNDGTGELRSIIDRMYEDDDNPNLMMLLSGNYDYLQAIDEENGTPEVMTKLEYSAVEDMYVSPSVKRPVWQALQILQELEGIIKKRPAKVFVEMTRKDDKEKRRTVSRKDKLKEALKDSDIASELENRTEEDLRQDKLYLYFSQMGKSMYTGKVIELDRLGDYDIDHIWPQSAIKDDSLDNRVLIEKNLNILKKDVYPLDGSIRESMEPYWKMLLGRRLISQKKYLRLVRTSALTEDEKADFINRQLIETSQTVKAITDILKQYYGSETRVVYVKASLVSDFRHHFDMLKCRAVNDLHHAKDAYLNIVCGNAYLTKYTDNPFNFMRNIQYDRDADLDGKDEVQRRAYYSLKHAFDYDIIRNNKVAWIKGDDGTISTVRKMMNRSNVLFTHFSYDKKGGLFDLQPVPHGKNEGLLPLKGNDDRYANTGRYGGYNSLKGSYFAVIKEGSTISVETIPIYLKENFRDIEKLKEYCVSTLGYNRPEVLFPHLKYGFVLERDGYRLAVSGKTLDRLSVRGNIQLACDIATSNLFHHIVKYNEKTAPIKLKIAELGKKTRSGDELEKLNQKLIDLIPVKLSNKNDSDKYPIFDDSKLVELYKWLIEKAESMAYRNRPNNFGKFLIDKLSAFESLSIQDKCYILEQILYMFGCSAVVSSDLRLLGGVAKQGVCLISKKLKGDELLVNQSITGLFEIKTPIVR